MRHRRPAECRQIDALQRADRDGGGAGGELSVLHHRAQCGRGGGARSAPRRAGEAREVGADRADEAHLRRHRRPGARRLEGGGARQPVPRHHPRGRCHRPCGALLRERRRHPCGRPHRSRRRHRDGRDRADARRSRQPGAASRRAGEEGQGRGQGSQAQRRSRHPRARLAARGKAGPARRDQAGGGEGPSPASAS